MQCASQSEPLGTPTVSVRNCLTHLPNRFASVSFPPELSEVCSKSLIHSSVYSACFGCTKTEIVRVTITKKYLFKPSKESVHMSIYRYHSGASNAYTTEGNQ